MQLDKTRVAIRERSYLDLLELSLRLLQGHAYPLVMAWLVGVLPFFFLNMFLLQRQVPGSIAWENSSQGFEEGEWFGQFMWYSWLEISLIVLEAPLATSLITLFLGQALFVERPPARKIATELWQNLGQLFFMQFVVRGATLVLFCVCACVWYWVWPYTSEIILLERNKQEITWRRMSELHRLNGGFLFARWLAAMAFGVILVISVWLSLLITTATLSNRFNYEDLSRTLGLTWEFPLALWIVFGFFTIVRFLSYLDLRIRGEGWELALALRALAATLKPKWT